MYIFSENRPEFGFCAGILSVFQTFMNKRRSDTIVQVDTEEEYKLHKTKKVKYANFFDLLVS